MLLVRRDRPCWVGIVLVQRMGAYFELRFDKDFLE
jgi:hypothetical protein